MTIDLPLIADALAADVKQIHVNIAACGPKWSQELLAQQKRMAAAGEAAIPILRQPDCTNERALEVLTEISRIIVKG